VHSGASFRRPRLARDSVYRYRRAGSPWLAEVRDAISKYHSSFWADEAGKQTALWKAAQQLCKAQEATTTPNCWVVFVVDTTVRIIAVYQDEDVGERLKVWIRGGTEELGLATSGSMPSPTKGFGPETLKMPTSAGK
jgi:hypothetical protein